MRNIINKKRSKIDHKNTKCLLYVQALKINNHDYEKTKEYLENLAVATNITLTKITRLSKNSTNNFYASEMIAIAEYMKIEPHLLIDMKITE